MTGELNIRQIEDAKKKQEITRNILEALTEWFEVEEIREQYIAESAERLGYSFMQGKTVQMGMYPDYDLTNLFYLGCGFKEFEVFPLLWDEANPCQIYVMALND
ncbi:MAG: hypothetical protein IJJ74_03400 [Eubacterium sp.]|nr:hypothetical protein [Eubacterium sp.]